MHYIHKMEKKELTKSQEEERKEWLKNYKFVNICYKCGTMYGSDLEEKIEICPACYIKSKKQKTK